MNDSVRHGVALTCHDSTPSPWVRGVGARVSITLQGALALAFRLDADLARLRIPPAAVPRRVDRLWEHTCFEAFVGVRGEAGYHEFNFSPSGEWAAYAFQRYRDGRPLEQDVTPGITVRLSDMLEAEAVIRAECLPPLPPASRRAALQIALAAVIEEESGRLSYWALRHPPGRPDFHCRDAFALELEAPHCAPGDLGNGAR